MYMSLYDPPTVAEVEKAIAALPSGMAPGFDATREDVYKAGGTRSAIKINELLETICSADGVLQEFKDAL